MNFTPRDILFKVARKQFAKRIRVANGGLAVDSDASWQRTRPDRHLYMSRLESEQKTLNNAFYATLFMAIASLLLVFLGISQLNLLGIITLFVFPILGFLTKRASLRAAQLLLVLFIADSAFWTVNWLSRVSSPMSIVGNILVRFAIWMTFYRAYLAIKPRKQPGISI